MPTLATAVLHHASRELTVGTFHASRSRSWGYSFWKPICLNRWFNKLDGRIAVSFAAMEFVSRYFPGDYAIIPNGIDLPHFSRQVTPLEQFFDGKLNILFVGRMEKRKNVNRLIQAFKEAALRTHLVLIGSEGDDFRVNQRTGTNVLYLGQLPYGAELLKSAYSACKVFALPSWFETPGIAALEAGAAGANVVITSRGSTREYFDEYAWYVDPSNVKSIRGALIDAYHSDRNPQLRQRILSEYTWERVAAETLKAYERVLNRKD